MNRAARRMIEVIGSAMIGVGAVLYGGGACAQSIPNASAPASAPASRPASEIVLVKIGDRAAITQADFNFAFAGQPSEVVERYKNAVVNQLIAEKLFEMYLDSHPDLVDEAAIQKELDDAMKAANLSSVEEWDRRLRENAGYGVDLLRRRLRLLKGRSALVRQADEKSKDEKFLREIYDSHPGGFDGTAMKVRHILISVSPFDTPEQVRAKRERLEKIREDLMAGRRTWSECVQESDDPTRSVGGELGFVMRYLDRPEPFAKAAFATRPGETSEVIQTLAGFHILQVTDVHKGTTTFEQAKSRITVWVERQAIINADLKMRSKHPVVGVRRPGPPPATAPAKPKPARPEFKPRTRPSTRPAINRQHPTTRPAMTRPATRPSAARLPSQVRPGATTRPSAISRPQRRPPVSTRPARRPPASTRPARP